MTSRRSEYSRYHPNHGRPRAALAALALRGRSAASWVVAKQQRRPRRAGRARSASACIRTSKSRAMSLACRLVCSAHTGRDACLQKRRPRVTCAQCWSIHSDEIQRWKYITPEEINEFRCPDGLLNEFKMFWHLRHRFPLHFLVFKQIACRGADDGKLF